MAKKTVLTKTEYSREEVERILKELNPKVVIDKNLQPHQVTRTLEDQESINEEVMDLLRCNLNDYKLLKKHVQLDIVTAKVDSGLGVLTAVLGSIAIYMSIALADNIYSSTALVLIGAGLLFGTAWLWTKK